MHKRRDNTTIRERDTIAGKLRAMGLSQQKVNGITSDAHGQLSHGEIARRTAEVCRWLPKAN